jgi:hypothetical protein
VPIVDGDSDDDEEESERVGSDDGVDEKVDVSSSDGSSGRGDDDDGDEEHGEEIDRHWAISEEFGQDGECLGAEVDVDHEVVSRPAASDSRFKCHRVHIFHDGDEVVTEDDEPGRGSGKHALGDASHSGLVLYVDIHSSSVR